MAGFQVSTEGNQRREPMESTTQSPSPTLRAKDALNELFLFSSGAMLDVSRLILDGSPLPDVLAVVARLAESRGNDAQCSIWLPERDGKQVYCAAAPSMPGLSEQVGPFHIGREGGPLGAAIHQQAPIYVTDILNDADWNGYLDLMSPFGTRALWARPFFTKDGQFLGRSRFIIANRTAQLLPIWS
jgi:formate hydrogenlyase transcriptional activator